MEKELEKERYQNKLSKILEDKKYQKELKLFREGLNLVTNLDNYNYRIFWIDFFKYFLSINKASNLKIFLDNMKKLPTTELFNILEFVISSEVSFTKQYEIFLETVLADAEYIVNNYELTKLKILKKQ